VYVYDEIRVEAEVTAKKQTRKGTWVCSYKWTVKNQRNEGVASGINT
jgi:acyl dehydratase